MRILNVVAVLLAISSAFLLYGLNYDTRMIERSLQARERDAERARADIAVLRAERAHLARPERIEPLARGLGLEPLSGATSCLDRSGGQRHHHQLHHGAMRRRCLPRCANPDRTCATLLSLRRDHDRAWWH